MEKSVIVNVKIDNTGQLLVHHLHKGMQQLHRDYGFWICHVGGYSALPNKELPRRYFEFYSLSHMYDGAGQFIDSAGCRYPVEAGQGILITPGYVHSYGAAEKPYVEDSICFYGPVADAFFKYKIIENGIMKIGLARRLLPIIQMASDPALDSQLSANVAFQKLLLELHHENLRSAQSEKYLSIKQLLEMLKDDTRKWWTVGEMSEICNLSTAQFRRVFKRHTGMLPKDYIDRLKLLQAADMLISEDVSMEQLAAQFGYRDPFHFSKRFKQITGFSPKRYRMEFHLNR